MITFKIEEDGDEFHAYCPELPGCHTHGKTRKEAMENLKDAIMLYLNDTMEEQFLNQKIEEFA